MGGAVDKRIIEPSGRCGDRRVDRKPMRWGRIRTRPTDCKPKRSRDVEKLDDWGGGALADFLTQNDAGADFNDYSGVLGTS